MTRFEKHVQKLFLSNGWQALRGGWPDFLMYRVVQGKLDLVAVEAKAKNDYLRANQEQMLALLSAAMSVKLVEEGPGYGPFFGQWESTCHLYDLARFERDNGLWITKQINPHQITPCACMWPARECEVHRFNKAVSQ